MLCNEQEARHAPRINVPRIDICSEASQTSVTDLTKENRPGDKFQNTGAKAIGKDIKRYTGEFNDLLIAAGGSLEIQDTSGCFRRAGMADSGGGDAESSKVVAPRGYMIGSRAYKRERPQAVPTVTGTFEQRFGAGGSRVGKGRNPRSGRRGARVARISGMSEKD